MLQLTNTASYRKDYKRYSLAIKKLQEPVHTHAQKLLSQFKTQSSIIDEGHNPGNHGTIDPRTLRDNIKTLVEIRRKLEQLIRDAR